MLHDSELDSDQRQLSEMVNRFVRQHGGIRTGIEQGGGAAAGTIWRELGDMGLLGIAVPEKHGGIGGDALYLMIIAEALGAGLMPRSFAASGVAAMQLMAAARPGELPALMEGSACAALVDGDPASPFQASRPTTMVSRGNGGLVLNGVQGVVAGSEDADLLLTYAPTEDGEFTLLLVPADAPGIRRNDAPSMAGAAMSALRFEGVAVPQEATICSGPWAAEAMDRARDYMVFAACADAVGAMRAIIDHTRQHVTTREQFGTTLGTFQAVRHHFANMCIAFQLAESVVYMTARSLDQLDARQRRRGVLAARLRVLKSAQIVGELGLQLNGGIAMAEEYAVGHYFKRLLLNEALYGGRAQQLLDFAD